VVFRFGDHVLDMERRELRRGAESVAPEPQVGLDQPAFSLYGPRVRAPGNIPI
jgi:hypothetical protein